jgi:hypothetical protein
LLAKRKEAGKDRAWGPGKRKKKERRSGVRSGSGEVKLKT